MINKLWRQYIYILITYSDAKGELKHTIANLMAIVLFIPINYLIFILVFNSEQYLAIFLISVGQGRLFLAYNMEKYRRDFGDYTPILRYIPYSSILFVTIGAIIVIVQESYTMKSLKENIKENQMKISLFRGEDKNKNLKKIYDITIDDKIVIEDIKTGNIYIYILNDESQDIFIIQLDKLNNIGNYYGDQYTEDLFTIVHIFTNKIYFKFTKGTLYNNISKEKVIIINELLNFIKVESNNIIKFK